MLKKKLVVLTASAALVTTTVVGGSVARAANSGDSEGTRTAAAVGTVAASTTTGATEVAFKPKPIKWGKCESAGLTSLGAKCGYLSVPLDYDKPKGKKIQIAVSRIKASVKKADRQG